MGELSQHDLQDYIDKYGCNVFVETGTGIGTGLSYALKFPFDMFFSIEIELELSLKAGRFADNRTFMINMDSVEGLQKILPMLSRDCRVLFWLDAHFPGADFQLRTYEEAMNMDNAIPLKKELETIVGSRDTTGDVLIIDDLRIWEKGDYELGNWDKFDQYGGGGIQWIFDMFPGHEAHRDMRHQGFLILRPKQ